ncbi:Microneme protein 13, related [Eimeria tenella]|uniref:Microneme protein 13, related n=1 Tax=Eimeria tenella TaxID=5802 RepID=U6L204_EIMTE|nr:Microneme protein 13, related [Eimeria tenella]CDJ44211.1 Microneme protein 13, related [Eimeria tenella]|eukprot:XP_013234960.1 Microneme protein 13, related [Eimeria tenella]
MGASAAMLKAGSAAAAPLRVKALIFLLLANEIVFSAAEQRANVVLALTLQERLNTKCEALSNSLCQGGNDSLCQNPAVYARRFPASSGALGVWRCYAGATINLSAHSLACVTNCGDPMNCSGQLTHISPIYFDSNSDMVAIIKQEKVRYCGNSRSRLSTAAAASGLQTLLDAECLKLHAKSCMEGQQQFCQPAVSRFKSNGPSGKSFSCYKTNELNYATTDNSCVDNCGNPVACAGAVGYASVYGEEQTKLRQVVETMTDAMCNISARN